jgi:two-component system chemotaxis sensor kinase CheA
MDVVRTNVEKIGGTIDLESRPGRGTTVLLKIPLTLAIIPALIVTSGGQRYAIPQVSLVKLLRLEGEQARRDFEHLHGVPVYRLRGNLLPLVFLNRLLESDPLPQRGNRAGGAAADPGPIHIVVLQADDRQFGLVVDAIHDTEEIVVKPLQQLLKGIGLFAGATIRGDGKVALILDVLGLAQRAHVITEAREPAWGEKPASALDTVAERQTVLVAATDDGGRLAIPLALVDRLEEFPRGALERVGPLDVVQYRGAILPLLQVSRLLGRRRRGRAAGDAPVWVVVCAVKGRRVGLVVGRILDIVEETLGARSPTRRAGVLFTAVIQGRVTEFLDVEGLLDSADPDLLEAPRPSAASPPAPVGEPVG